MSFSKYKYLIFSDLFRICGNKKISSLLFQLVFGVSYKYVFWMRTSSYLRQFPLLKFNLYLIPHCILKHYEYKFGISIHCLTMIGSGFYIGHFGGIIVNPESKIGKNCNISQGVTLGQANRGKNIGSPIIGDNVYIGPGAKIVGSVKVGNDVAIGANCVVTKDVPDHAVVVGVPGKVISYDGSYGYINRIDY